jgi:2,4-diaminopentanoate dehydrogenase
MGRRVIQWGAGSVGTQAMNYVLDRDDLELVGVRCYTDRKVGRDAGELAGRDPIGVAATTDSAALLALDADCVLFMPGDGLLDPTAPGSPSRTWVDEVLPILRSGKNVVSSLAAGMHWAHLADGEALRDELDGACAEGNASIFFTGIDPGFITDCLAITMTTVVGRISQVRTFELIDYGPYPGLAQMDALGFGRRPDDVDSATFTTVAPTWACALYQLADATGVELSRTSLDADFYISPDRSTAPSGMVVEAGTIGALRWTLTGFVGDQPRFVINHINRMGAGMAPDWPKMDGYEGGYRIEIDGFPPYRGDFPLGLPGGTGTALKDAVAMTAARCVNYIEAVVTTSPGYKTTIDLPTVGARYGLQLIPEAIEEAVV